MDFRTTMRELDEVIAKAQMTITQALATLDVLPPCTMRQDKQQRVASLQSQLSRLLRFRAALKQRRPAGSMLQLAQAPSRAVAGNS
jgi:hypothetical protein